MHRRAHISSKNNNYFHMLLSLNENLEQEPNPRSLYLYLSGSEFLVSFRDPDLNLLTMDSVCK